MQRQLMPKEWRWDVRCASGHAYQDAHDFPPVICGACGRSLKEGAVRTVMRVVQITGQVFVARGSAGRGESRACLALVNTPAGLVATHYATPEQASITEEPFPSRDACEDAIVAAGCAVAQ